MVFSSNLPEEGEEGEWTVIRRAGITVAQGYKCPSCGLIQMLKICPHCNCVPVPAPDHK